MKEVKCIAELIKWSGEVIVQEIKKDWVSDITSAVIGQYAFADKVRGFAINGGDYMHVNIYEVENGTRQIDRV